MARKAMTAPVLVNRPLRGAIPGVRAASCSRPTSHSNMHRCYQGPTVGLDLQLAAWMAYGPCPASVTRINWQRAAAGTTIAMPLRILCWSRCEGEMVPRKRATAMALPPYIQHLWNQIFHEGRLAAARIASKPNCRRGTSIAHHFCRKGRM